jgi:hypothetical protein
LATVISPQFVRRREDKSVRPQDVRIAQVTDIVEVPQADRDARQLTLPQSNVLRREIYTKELKGQTMVRKFVMWQTNKAGDEDEYPAYVVHYTDFSPNRKDALAREVRVTNSDTQIEELWNSLKEENIKAGWARLEAGQPATVDAQPAEAKPARRKAATKAPAEAETPQPTDAPTEELAPSKRARAPRKKKSG